MFEKEDTTAKASPTLINRKIESLKDAIVDGNLEKVQQLIKEDRGLIAERDNNGFTALLWASFGGHLRLVKWLLQEGGATITERDHKGNTALLLAIKRKHVELSWWLYAKSSRFVFSQKEISRKEILRIADFVRPQLKNGLLLWLDFVSFLSIKPLLPLKKCEPLIKIFAFTGKNKEQLILNTLGVLLDLFESPQKKALGLAIYRLHEQDLKPSLDPEQKQLIKQLLEKDSSTQNHQEDLTQITSIESASSVSLYYQRLAKEMAGTVDEPNEIWLFIDYICPQNNAVFYTPLIWELKKFISIHNDIDNTNYLALEGILKEDKLFHFLNNSKVLAQAPLIQIKETCNRFLQSKIDSTEQQNAGYVLSEVLQWLRCNAFRRVWLDSLNYPALSIAAREGRLDVVKWLVREGRASLYENNDGHTPLLEAAENGHINVAEWLLREGGATTTERNFWGDTALFVAIKKDQLQMVQWLLRERWFVITETDGSSYQALSKAAHRGNLEMMQLLLQEGGAAISDRSNDGTTVLLIAAAGGYLAMVQWLLGKGGATITEKTNYGDTALLLAAQFGKLSVVQWLLQKGGAAITENNNKGETTLSLAVLGGHLNLVEWLLCESGFLFTTEEIDFALSRVPKHGVENSAILWLEFYQFISLNPSSRLTECIPFTQILEYKGYIKHDKALLRYKTLSLPGQLR